MATEITVPQLGESVVEATIAHWLKQVGDTVSPGDGVVELETEKVNIEVPAEAGGVLASIAHQEGETVRIGDVLGTLEEGRGSSSEGRREAGAAGNGAARPVPAAAPAGREAGSGGGARAAQPAAPVATAP